MPTTTWSIVSKAGKQHTIRLEHGYFSGKREITVDQNVVAKGKQLIDGGSRHTLIVDDTVYEVIIHTNGATFSYFLCQEGVPIPSDKQRAAGKTTEDIYKKRIFRDLPLWVEVGRTLGLRYKPIDFLLWPYRHQLIGLWRETFIVIRAGAQPKTGKPGYTVMVRHAPFTSKEQLDRIQADPRVKSAHGRLDKHPGDLGFDNNASIIFLPKVRNETATELTARIQSFVSAVCFHTAPLTVDVCENEPFRHCSGRNPEWVMVNHTPYYLCPECLNEVPNWGKEAEKEYRASPNNLLPGLLAGFGVALLGAIVWAAFGLLLDIMAAVAAYLIFVSVFVVMRKVGAKVTLLSVLGAVLLTFFSVTLGHSFLTFLALLREGLPVSAGTLSATFESVIQSPRMLFMPYFFTFLGAAPSLWSVIGQHRASLQNVFKPQVERLPLRK